MAALWGVLVALLALGEGRGGPPRATPGPGGEGNPENGSAWGGGGAGPPPRGGPWWFWGAPGGSLGGSLGALAAAYLGLGGAVLVGLHLRHRALRNRKRRKFRRGPARRFFRASLPEPPNPYGNVPGPRPAPTAPLPPPQEEGEGDEGYEEPESGSYENAPGALGGGAGWPYEVMAAGEGRREPPWRGRGSEEDAASYENMEGALGCAPPPPQ